MEQAQVEGALAARPAPRVTPERIAAVIVGEQFTRLTGTLTVCVLELANGFTVTGESACASPENYDQSIGEHFAREDAKRKIWPLEGYLLRQRLSDGANAQGIVSSVGEGRNPDYRGDAMDIGQALAAMREGCRVARAGWNGKGMFLYFVGPGAYPAASPAAKAVWGDRGLVPYLPYIAMKTVSDEVVPWLASQTDLLATDWVVLPL